MNRRFLIKLVGSLMLLAAVTPILAKDVVFSNRKGAIRGYDSVAYFTEGKPVKGSKEFTYEWHGAKWRFSSQENLDLFKGDPDKYAPQYGGYCAYGLSKNSLVKINPDAWTIHEGKLYLNYSKSVRNAWNENRNGFINSADKYYAERTEG